jgi:two-component system response regulator AlgR
MALDILLVDDEALARRRLRTLLGECPEPAIGRIDEAEGATDATARLAERPYHVALLDIHMPGANGLVLAGTLRSLPRPPAVVFVTAHAEHAVSAFELEAVDYLTKPVRGQRLQQALQKAERWLQAQGTQAAAGATDALLIQDRGRTERVPLAEVLYLKAELKYVTVRTAARSYILDGSLSELEERHAGQFLRIHRNALVARRAIRALERQHGSPDGEDGDGWAVRLDGLPELLAVSRRQLSAVREAIGH